MNAAFGSKLELALQLPVGNLFGSREFGSRAVLLYLSTPAIIFLFSFTLLPIAIGAGVLIVAANTQIFIQERHRKPALTWAGPLLGSLAMLWIVGFTRGTFCWDWIKHWALVNELANNEWPLVLNLDGVPQYIRFYIGAYLPAALAHRLLPSLPTVFALGAWFGLGYVLVFRMVAGTTMRRHAAWASIILFSLIGGADFFVEHVTRLARGLPQLPLFGLHYESWPVYAKGMPLEYSSMMTALIWVPHQSIATFLVAGMLILRRDTQAFIAATLGFGLLSLWSPYGMIGLLPLMLVTAYQQRGALKSLKAWLPVLAGTIFTLVIVSYLTTEIPSAGACFECILARIDRLDAFFLFWLVELCVFVLILRTKIVRDIGCLVSLITLLALPLMYGQTPDFVMRGSMGPLFVLSVRSVQMLLEKPSVPWSRLLHGIALVLCVPAAVSQVVYQVEAGATHRQLASADPLNKQWMDTFATRTDYTMQQFLDICGWHYKGQYLSTKKPAIMRENVSN
jgi:hypothetical protein